MYLRDSVQMPFYSVFHPLGGREPGSTFTASSALPSAAAAPDNIDTSLLNALPAPVAVSSALRAFCEPGADPSACARSAETLCEACCATTAHELATSQASVYYQSIEKCCENAKMPDLCNICAYLCFAGGAARRCQLFARMV